MLPRPGALIPYVLFAKLIQVGRALAVNPPCSDVASCRIG